MKVHFKSVCFPQGFPKLFRICTKYEYFATQGYIKCSLKRIYIYTDFANTRPIFSKMTLMGDDRNIKFVSIKLSDAKPLESSSRTLGTEPTSTVNMVE